MKFCQTDGTVLVDDATSVDPYKTVVGNQSDLPVPPLDPFKTMVASPPKMEDDDDLLQLPEESDAMKTMIVSQDEFQQQSKADAAENVSPLDLPPAASAPLIEPEKPGLSDTTSKSSSISEGNAPPKSDSIPFQNDFSGQSPYGNTDNLPIPSPFQDSIPPGGFAPPPNSPFNEPKPSIKEPEPMFSEQSEPANQSPFGGQSPSTPFGQADPFNQPLGQAEWTPPPAPVAAWQDQGLGADTPFQPPVATGGQDQTLAIVSLVCGILGILCCGLLSGIPAIITGYMAKNNVDSNPSQYGGRGLAVAGMILGGVSVLFSILGIIYYIVMIVSMSR
jgi:hypothetical protein